MTEAPIEQTAALGDWDEPRRWWRADRQLPSRLQTYRDVWSKVPYRFNHFFWSGPHYFLQEGKVTPEWLRRHLGADAEPILAAHRPDVITIVHTSNEADNLMPLTPWMVGHIRMLYRTRSSRDRVP